MDKKEQLAEIFAGMASLMELSGENTFKVRAYENASRTLLSSPEPLTELTSCPPKGFGKGLIEKAREFLDTGVVAEHEELKAKFPPSLFDLLNVQGLGPKKVKILYEELKISDLETLEAACKENKLLDLKGFGAKTQEKILTGIGFLKQFRGQFLFCDVEQEADKLLAYLKKSFPDTEFHLAGSFRRKKEMVKDLDVLVASDGAPAIMKCFVTYPEATQILMEGETKSAIQTNSGLQIDLRVVPPESLGPALCHFTGSKEHNTRMRSLALSQGKKLNEYGLFEGETALPMVSEEEVFSALGLEFIPPELREDQGEIEWAAKHAVPKLVESRDLIGTLHCHTVYSDGRTTPEQMALAAKKLGLTWLGISDHSKSAFYANGMNIDAVQAQWAMIDELNGQNPDFRIFKGIESDILPDGSLDYPDEILAGFDFVIASVHSTFTMSSRDMTERVIKAIQSPFVDILGHPTGRLLLTRDAFEIDLDKVLAACQKFRTAVEINGNPARLDLDWRKVRTWRESGLKFVITPDAHSPEGLADIRYGLGIARKGGLEPAHLLNCLSFKQLTDTFRARRTA